MPPANISFRRRSKRRFVLPLVVALLAAGGGLYFIGRDGAGPPAPKKEPETPQVTFAVTGYTLVAEGKAPAKTASDQEKQAIIDLFTDYYQTAFVDPKAWSDPAFPTIAARFVSDAKATFTRDIASLTIGDGRIDLRRVEPTLAQIKLSVYFDPKQRPTFAVAAIQFRAKATTKDKKPVDVVQDATYRLQRVPGGWLIFSYAADSKQDTPVPSPSPTGSPSA